MEWVTKSTDDKIVKELESSVPSTERIAKLLALEELQMEATLNALLNQSLPT